MVRWGRVLGVAAWCGAEKGIMKLSEIKEAVLAGKVVHWKSEGYRVIHAPKFGGFLIRFDYNGSMTGLTWADGVTMNEREEDFFLGGGVDQLIAT